LDSNIIEEEIWYIAEKELEGFEPDGPNWIPETNTYDDGKIIVPANTILKFVDFDLYHMEFEMVETKKRVCLHRERVCDDVASSKYYDNYFAPVEGLKEINAKELSCLKSK